MRSVSLLVLLVAAACTDAPALPGLPQGYPLETEAAEVADELDLHRANLTSCLRMDELAAELVRHRTVSQPRYDALRVRLEDMRTCATSEGREELDSLMNGIAATELGRDAAVSRARGLGDARHSADVYAQGVAELLDRMIHVSMQQADCFH